MKDNQTELTTEELWTRLFQAPTIGRFFEENESSCKLPNFSEYITELCKLRKEKPGTIIKRSNIESSFGHRLFSGMRNPSRDTVLLLAFGFELTSDETQQMLKIARHTPLHPKVKRDALIAYCLYYHKGVVETQQMLYENHLPLLGGAKLESK